MINYSIVMRSVNANLLEINQAKSRINQAKKEGKNPDQKDLELVKTEKQNAFAISQYTDIMTIEKFAKHRDALRNALRGYTKLNAKAFEKIRPGGILFTFSCSQVVNKQDFRNAVFTAAAQSGRSVRILHQLTQPGDHPVNIYHPEGEYLKGLVLYVE